MPLYGLNFLMALKSGRYRSSSSSVIGVTLVTKSASFESPRTTSSRLGFFGMSYSPTIAEYAQNMSRAATEARATMTKAATM